jgi:hypothetical protein
MAVQFSDQVLEAMGFRALQKTELIAARFHCLHVYEIQGLTLAEKSLPARLSNIGGRVYSIAFGTSVNAVSHALVGNELSEDEHEWQRELKCTPPYCVVHFGPTELQRFSGTHGRFEDPMIHTYDGFQVARRELKIWANDVLPSLLAGLAASFNTNETPVKFLPIDSAFYGITCDGQTVLDTYISVNATGHVSSSLTANEATDRLESAVSIAKGMNQKVAQFFHLALHEVDPLKRFLYFFLAVEIETHATFATVDHAQNISNLIHSPSRATKTAQAFFDSQREKWTNLRDRFAWCVLCAWPSLSDTDVDNFKHLKKIRDEIAHGSIANPPTDAVMLIEKLATKLLLPAK